MKRHKIPVVLAGILMLLTLLWTRPAFAADVDVSTMQGLKQAIVDKNSITLTADIEVKEELTIPADYNGTIKSEGKTLSLASGVNNMFVIAKGANVTFDNIVFDGKEKGRIIDAGEATVTIKNSTLQNATTDTFGQKIVDNKDTQRYEGGAIYAAHTTLNLENTNFENNHTKATVPSPGAPHGGAIVSYSAKIKITGGSFINNHTGKVDKEYSSHGEGGAINNEV